MSTSLEREIASIIATLEAPLAPEERAAGWTKAVKSGYAETFSDLLTQLRVTGTIPYFGVVRSLDGYGIGGGDLYERMLRVANEANHRRR